MQDVIEKIRDAERRAEATEKKNAELSTRVAVLEGRYGDLKQTLDGVVQTQGAQGERLSALGEKVDSVGERVIAVRDDLRTITNRVWTGSAAGAGGTGALALLFWFLMERGAM